MMMTISIVIVVVDGGSGDGGVRGIAGRSPNRIVRV